MVGEKHTQQAKRTQQQPRVVGNRSRGIRAPDQSCFYLSRLWLCIRDLVWTTTLIGTGVSAFTTGDIWVIPSLLVLLRVSSTTFRRIVEAGWLDPQDAATREFLSNWPSSANFGELFIVRVAGHVISPSVRPALSLARWLQSPKATQRAISGRI